MTNTQLNKLKYDAKNKTGTTIRLNKKKFKDAELLHELFLTTRQRTNIRNAFANYTSTDMKLSYAPNLKLTPKTIQSSEPFGSWLGKLGKKALTNIAIPLARENLTSNAINSLEEK